MNAISIEKTAFPTFDDSQLQSLAGIAESVRFDGEQELACGIMRPSRLGTILIWSRRSILPYYSKYPSEIAHAILARGYQQNQYARVLESANGRILMEGFDPFRSTWLPKRFRGVRADLPRRTWSFVKRQNAFVRIK